MCFDSEVFRTVIFITADKEKRAEQVTAAAEVHTIFYTMEDIKQHYNDWLLKMEGIVCWPL